MLDRTWGNERVKTKVTQTKQEVAKLKLQIMTSVAFRGDQEQILALGLSVSALWVTQMWQLWWCCKVMAGGFWSCFQCSGVSVSWRRSWWSQTVASHQSEKSCPTSPPSYLTLRAFCRKQPALSRRLTTGTEQIFSNIRGMRWFLLLSTTFPPLSLL